MARRANANIDQRDAMTINEFLGLIDGARSIGSGRWLAKCPAHDDQRPSLSIHEGERGILLRCWSGCSLAEICSSLGIEAHQLFYDSGKRLDRGAIHRRQQEKSSRYDWRADSQERKIKSDALFLESEVVLSKARNLDVSQWTDEDFSKAWAAIEGPLRQRVRSDQLQSEAFLLRVKHLNSDE